jgi:hypothetical protein
MGAAASSSATVGGAQSGPAIGGTGGAAGAAGHR